MATNPQVPTIIQEGPPPGGYEYTRWIPKFPVRGPSGLMIGGMLAATFFYGMYQIGQENIDRAAIAHDIRDRELAMKTLRQAEVDRITVRTEYFNMQVEAGLMGDVKGWTVGEGPYFSRKSLLGTGDKDPEGEVIQIKDYNKKDPKILAKLY